MSKEINTVGDLVAKLLTFDQKRLVLMYDSTHEFGHSIFSVGEQEDEEYPDAVVLYDGE